MFALVSSLVKTMREDVYVCASIFCIENHERKSLFALVSSSVSIENHERSLFALVSSLVKTMKGGLYVCTSIFSSEKHERRSLCLR